MYKRQDLLTEGAINEKSHFLPVPVEEDVDGVPRLCRVLEVHELLRIDLEGLIEAQPMEDWRRQSTFLSLVFLKRKCSAAALLTYFIALLEKSVSEQPSATLGGLGLMRFLEQAQIAAFAFCVRGLALKVDVAGLPLGERDHQTVVVREFSFSLLRKSKHVLFGRWPLLPADVFFLSTHGLYSYFTRFFGL